MTGHALDAFQRLASAYQVEGFPSKIPGVTILDVNKQQIGASIVHVRDVSIKRGEATDIAVGTVRLLVTAPSARSSDEDDGDEEDRVVVDVQIEADSDEPDEEEESGEPRERDWNEVMPRHGDVDAMIEATALQRDGSDLE
jgi:hypothetical protein